MRNVVDQLEAAGEPVSEADLVRYILNGLGAEFNSFVVTITTREKSISISDLHAFLLTHEKLIETQQGLSNLSTSSLPSSQNPSAYYSNPRPRSGPPRPGYNQRSTNGGSRPNSQNRHHYTHSQTTAPILSNPPHRPNQAVFQPNNPQTRPYNPDRAEICQLCSKRCHIAKNCWYITDYVPQQNQATFQSHLVHTTKHQLKH
ncbi:uncharacterized protein LOC144555621 [Carex rostrata]